jgi:broad specificity phosphatase PhoE
LVIAHGGPIAALRSWLAGEPLERMIDFVPRCGELIALPQSN